MLQPIAHSLLQMLDEVKAALIDFPPHLLWTRPAGVASVGFHLQHIAGVVDRLTTYARNEGLSPRQFAELSTEGTPSRPDVTADELIERIRTTVDTAIEQLRQTDEQTLTDAREVGRRRLPSTVMGLLFHAAEHAQRHLGQLLVTVRIQFPRPEPVQE